MCRKCNRKCSGSCENELVCARKIKARKIKACKIKANKVEVNELKVKRLEVVEKLKVKCLEADKVDATDVNATNVNATNVNATNVNAENVDATNVNAENVDATNVNAENVDATNVNAEAVCACAIKTPSTILGQETTSATMDDLNADLLLASMERLINGYFGENSIVLVTIPDFDWTGFQPIPVSGALARKTVNAKQQTPNDLVQNLLSLSALICYEIYPGGKYSALSTDIKNTQFLEPGLNRYFEAMIEMFNLLLDNDVPADEPQILGLKVGISFFKTLANSYANDLYFFEPDFTGLYFTVVHKFYNRNTNGDSSFYGFLQNNWFTWNWGFLGFIPPEFWGLDDKNAEMIPKALIYLSTVIKESTKFEKQSHGNYYRVRFFVDAPNSSLYTYDGVDPDGYPRPEGFELENFNNPGIVMTYSQLDSLDQPWDDLQVFAPVGVPWIITNQENADPFGYFSVNTFIEELAATPEHAEEILCECRNIWETVLRPLWRNLKESLVVTREESQDDFYAGSWRAKLPEVKSVHREENPINPLNPDYNLAVYFVTSYDETHDVSVPMPYRSDLNQEYANNQAGPLGTTPEELVELFEEYQSAIQEMDTWNEINLQMVQDLHDGDQFNLLFKVDLNRGICGPPETGTIPYTSVEEILSNYNTEVKTVGVDASLGDLIFQSGFAVNQILYDLKEYVGNEYVKQYYVDFDFATPEDAGVCRVNQSGHEVTYLEAINSALERSANNMSDIQILGRHYGYNADGTKKDDEWNGDDLIYNYFNFQYVYRQHYAITEGNFEATNLSDQNSARPNQEYYQYTAPEDVENGKREEFLNNFRDNEILNFADFQSGTKQGTYFRWISDWVAQKLGGLILDRALDDDLLDDPFLTDYYKSTFVDTNGEQCYTFDKTSTQTLYFRFWGKVGGVATGGSSIDFPTQSVISSTSISTLTPKDVTGVTNNIGLILHELVLGHGFDSVPNLMDVLRGNPSEISWLSNVNQNFGFLTEGQIETYTYTGPGAGPLFEGWATYGELLGIINGYYVRFDENGCPDINTFNSESAVEGLVVLSRIGARQVVCVTENFSKYAWSVYHSAQRFVDLTNIPIALDPEFHTRFIGGPMQQTGYAAGLVTNLGLISAINNIIDTDPQYQGCEFSQAGYNQFRITRTDYILGATLIETALENIDLFVTNCP